MKKIIIITISLVILVLLVLTGCGENKPVEIVNPDTIIIDNPDITLTGDSMELFATDVFKDLENFDSRKITVLGAKLGYNTEEVISKAGMPDNVQDFGDLGINYEYSNRLGINETVLILHFDDGILTRFTVFKEANHLLEGKTIIDYTEAEMYKTFGLPDKTWPLNVNMKFMYNAGFDIMADEHRNAVAISFLDPEEQEYLTQQIYQTGKRVVYTKDLNATTNT